MQDIIAPARDAALMPAPPKTAQPSKHGYVIITLGFSTALGLGLAGGANLHRIVDLDKTATWVWKSGSILQSGFEVQRDWQQDQQPHEWPDVGGAGKPGGDVSGAEQ